MTVTLILIDCKISTIVLKRVIQASSAIFTEQIRITNLRSLFCTDSQEFLSQTFTIITKYISSVSNELSTLWPMY